MELQENHYLFLSAKNFRVRFDIQSLILFFQTELELNLLGFSNRIKRHIDLDVNLIIYNF